MQNRDERNQASLFIMVSLDKKHILIKNEGKAIARKVLIQIASEGEQPILSDLQLNKAQIDYMPSSQIKLDTNPLAKGYFKTTVTWEDDFKDNNELVFHLYK